MSEITGYIEVPFHGESAYEIAKKHGYNGSEKEWIESIGTIDEEEMDKIKYAVAQKVHGFVWYVDVDTVRTLQGESIGTMKSCMIDEYVGAWFYVRTNESEAGSHKCPAGYVIDGSNGYVNLRDYVVWTGKRLIRVNAFEAKASTTKNSDGRYSSTSGVDGLMSSTQAAYLTDLINQHWGKSYSQCEVTGHTEAGLINWINADGVHYVTLGKGSGKDPMPDESDKAYIVFVGREYDGSKFTGRKFQLAQHIKTRKTFYRCGNVAAGGSFGAYEWTQLSVENEQINTKVQKFFMFTDNNLETEYERDTLYVTGAAKDENIQRLIIPKMKKGEAIKIEADTFGSGNTFVELSIKDNNDESNLSYLGIDRTETQNASLTYNVDLIHIVYIYAISDTYYSIVFMN